MKNLTLIIATIAFVFGMNPQSVQASDISLPTSELVRSSGSATYDEKTEQILVNLRTDQLERVFIQVIDSNGNMVFSEKVSVNSSGLEMKISLQGMSPGIYHIKMRGNTIAIGNRFKKK